LQIAALLGIHEAQSGRAIQEQGPKAEETPTKNRFVAVWVFDACQQSLVLDLTSLPSRSDDDVSGVY
jgi:hypothetical protein